MLIRSIGAQLLLLSAIKLSILMWRCNAFQPYSIITVWPVLRYAHDILTRNWYQILVPVARFLVPEAKMTDNAHEIDAVCTMAVIVVKQRANRKGINGNVDPTTKMQLHAQLGSNAYL